MVIKKIVKATAPIKIAVLVTLIIPLIAIKEDKIISIINKADIRIQKAVDDIIKIDKVVTVIRPKSFIKVKLTTYNRTIKPLVKGFVNNVVTKKIRIFL